ncbi:MAG: DUF2891 domain-containing protein [Noviherbaspirillum sp.]
MRADHSADRHASAFAQLALANIEQEYPNKPDHVLNGAGDARTPRELHPAFYGSYDWHSCVHMHWLLARLLRRFPQFPEAAQIRTAFDRHFIRENIAAEIAYLEQPSRQSFERPYGWAWLLKLQTELLDLADVGTWHRDVQPLADLFADRYLRFLPLAQYPIRAGTHANSAFGLLFALDYAQRSQHLALRKLIAGKAGAWFGRDRCYPASYEPSGDDFLSAGLIEAALMLRVLDGCSYADWWAVFCPQPQDLQVWLQPVAVSDRSDPKLAHLDGLNLSRAWCWKMIEAQLQPALRAQVSDAIDAHLTASLPHATGVDYAGTHWLASFALLALTER